MRLPIALISGILSALPAPALRYLALGDSYTIGEGVAAAQRWPVQLAQGLRQRDWDLAPPRIVARTGWTTQELASALDRAALKPCYDLVSLSIGVNDQYRGHQLAHYQSAYRQMLQRAIKLAGGQPANVFVLSIPDWAVTPFARQTGRDLSAQSAQIEAYNGAMRDLTEQHQVLFIDITPSTVAAATDSALLAEDGLHPSGALYRQWAEQALPRVAALLEARKPC